MGKIEPEVSGFKLLFWEGAVVANSYKHVFGRDGREKEEIQHYNESLPKKVFKSESALILIIFIDCI